MADADNILSEALMRIEHKLDILLTNLVRIGGHKLMSFQGNICPVCTQTVEYQVDIQQQVVKRKCGCSTGKQPNLVSLIPIQGVGNGTSPVAASPERESGAEDGVKRKGR